MIISILGCGWYGLPFGKMLVNNGYLVKGSTTSPEKLPVLEAAGINPYHVNFAPGQISFEPDFFACDILWISIPPKRRAGEAGDYVEKIKRIAEAATGKTKQVVFISSTAVFADDDQTVNELTIPSPDTESGNALLEAEELLKSQTAFTTTILRFAGLIGPGRHPGRFFAGKKDIPNGQAPVNLVHLDDCIGMSSAILTKQLFGGVFHACGPHHPTKSHCYTLATRQIGLETPEFIDELERWKIISSANTSKTLNYQYQVPDWDQWLTQ